MTKEIKDLGGNVVTSTSDTTTICISNKSVSVPFVQVSSYHSYMCRGSGEDVKDDEGSQVT